MGVSVEVTSVGDDFITLAEAKAHLVVDHDDDDALIAAQITAACRYCEHRTNRFFTPTNVTLSRNGFDSEMVLKHKPIQEIVSIVYDDSDSTDNTLSDSIYELDAFNQKVRLAYGQTFPSTRSHWNSVRINYRVGYYTATSPEVVSVPEDVKRAALIVLGDLYANRERQQDMQLYSNYTADMLLAYSRVYE